LCLFAIDNDVLLLIGTIANIGILYGGTSVEHQHGLLHVGCTVLVATLGRLHQFVNENKVLFVPI
jgi:superfamily II DNA/RNA helicase